LSGMNVRTPDSQEEEYSSSTDCQEEKNEEIKGLLSCWRPGSLVLRPNPAPTVVAANEQTYDSAPRSSTLPPESARLGNQVLE
jgi:hypothetical protein